MKIDVSIIMSVYNETIEQLEKSIYSILNQNFSNFEFIIVLDNPSNIAAKEFIFNITDKRIIFLQNESNK
jgi:glycosyltransferase involved in cell wall biosynthesis